VRKKRQKKKEECRTKNEGINTQTCNRKREWKGKNGMKNKLRKARNSE